MTALFREIVGFGLDDPRRQPEIAEPVADDLAQQFAGDLLGVAVEEAVRQGIGFRPGQAWMGIAGHGAAHSRQLRRSGMILRAQRAGHSLGG
ncbi:hypothetical protein D3C78_1279710 [compost metagenome]